MNRRQTNWTNWTWMVNIRMNSFHTCMHMVILKTCMLHICQHRGPAHLTPKRHLSVAIQSGVWLGHKTHPTHTPPPLHSCYQLIRSERSHSNRRSLLHAFCNHLAINKYVLFLAHQSIAYICRWNMEIESIEVTIFKTCLGRGKNKQIVSIIAYKATWSQ